MAAPANELQKAVYDLLVADSAVHQLVEDRIYDRVPSASEAVPPYITFGPSDEVSGDDICFEAAEHTLQVDVWSEKAGGFKECKEITFAVKRALHLVEIDLPTHALIRMVVVQRRHFRDPDQITSHGVVVIEAEIEEL